MLSDAKRATIRTTSDNIARPMLTVWNLESNLT